MLELLLYLNISIVNNLKFHYPYPKLSHSTYNHSQSLADPILICNNPQISYLKLMDHENTSPSLYSDSSAAAGHPIVELNHGQRWRQIISENGPRPDPRSGAASVVHENSLYIFGGYGGNGRLDDLWEYRFFEEQWQKLSASGRIPAGRENNGAVIYKDSIYIFGGYSGLFWLNDFHKLDLCNFYIEVLSNGRRFLSEKDMPRVPDLDMLVLFGRTHSLYLEATTAQPGSTTCTSSTSQRPSGPNSKSSARSLQSEAARPGQPTSTPSSYSEATTEFT